MILTPRPEIYPGTRMHFSVFSRRSLAEANYCGRRVVVISITDPGSPPAEVPQRPGLLDVLRLEFHDCSLRPRDCQRMTPEQAREVVDFARNYASQVDLIICQCEAGICRSAAVASALSLALNGPDSERWFHDRYAPNAHVRDLIVAELVADGLDVTREVRR